MTHFVAEDPPHPQMERMSLGDKAGAMLLGVRVGRPRNQATPADVGLAYTTERIPDGTATLEGWYIPSPQAQGLVILFHSYATAKDSLLGPAQVFHDLGYGTLLVDFQGSGGSSGADTTLGVREAGDVAAAVAYADTT